MRIGSTQHLATNICVRPEGILVKPFLTEPAGKAETAGFRLGEVVISCIKI